MASQYDTSDTPNIIRSFAVFENNRDDFDNTNTNRRIGGKCIGRCAEIRNTSPQYPLSNERIDLDNQPTRRQAYTFPSSWTDAIDTHCQTSERSFLFPSSPASQLDGGKEQEVRIRQIPYGFGRLGAAVWPSGIALSCLLSGVALPLVEGKRVLELGSGCGLPSLVAKEAAGSLNVLATDYWEEEGDGRSKRKTGDEVPRSLFGANLAYNLGSDTSVMRLDWHDELAVNSAANDFCPDVIIGSDLVYYPKDCKPLVQALNILLRGSARDALLVLPLPPNANREALPEFISRLEHGEIASCKVEMDEFTMITGNGCGEDRHNLLRVYVTKP